MNDYRNTDYCKTLCDIYTKKEEFKKQMIKDHPRMTNYYRYISENGGQYKRQFIELYNDKCVYCGNSLDNITIELFEIDHFINEASFQGADKKNAHKIENLVPACQLCNRGKSGLTIEGDYIDVLNPESGELPKVFYRDEKYYIQISDDYKADDFIERFYIALALGKESRRLDYLLLKMKGLTKKLEDGHKVKQGLTNIINVLQQKRNRFY